MAKKNSALKDRLNKSYQDRDRGGAGQSAFDWKKAGDLKFYKMKAGKHRLNIIPYIIKTKNHPLVKSGDAKVGEEDYRLDIFIHRGIGPAQTPVICPKKNFGKACPICAQADEYREQGKQKEASAFRAQRRELYNVIDANDSDAGLQILDVSQNLFGKELIEAAKEENENGDIVDFPDIDDGKIVKFRATDAEFGGHAYFEFKNFGFEDREEKLDKDLIKQACSFDEFMKLYSSEEIEKILYGNDEDSEDDSKEQPKNKASKKDDEDDDDVGNDDSDDDDEEEDETEEEDEEEESDDEEDEPEDEEEDEEPAKPAKKVTKEKPAKETASKCPHKHIFGTDCNKFKKHCDDCDDWDKCLKEQKKLAKK
jgi:hypothetical protein